ncbi:anti-sigma factor antagonist [Marinifilum sp. JC120]|nr:anti-sigma factor antagonist [Marinifilum sp. JC120]
MRDLGAVSGDSATRQGEVRPVRFELTERQIEDVVILCPKGSINSATVPLFRELLYHVIREEGCKVIMSCSEVDSIDSMGLGVMIAAHKNSDKYGGMIVYSDMNDMITKNMKMLTMDRYLNLTPDLDSALMKFDW